MGWDPGVERSQNSHIFEINKPFSKSHSKVVFGILKTSLMKLSSLNKSKTSISKTKPLIGIIGGSGFDLFSEMTALEHVKPLTKFGYPSDEITIGNYAGVTIAFLPRHGKNHQWPPHRIPYKANIAALEAVGVKYIFATCIAGSLKKRIKPGSVVIPDQFVNFTWGRDDSFDADGGYSHIPMKNPYCAHLRDALKLSVRKITKNVFPKGTVVVVQGPRFSTKAESKFFNKNGWDIINMTQYPECCFAREMGMCYAAFAVITDYDVGIQKEFTMEPENIAAVEKIFKFAVTRTKDILATLITTYAKDISCNCAIKIVGSYERH